MECGHTLHTPKCYFKICPKAFTRKNVLFNSYIIIALSRQFRKQLNMKDPALLQFQKKLLKSITTANSKTVHRIAFRESNGMPLDGQSRVCHISITERSLYFGSFFILPEPCWAQDGQPHRNARLFSLLTMDGISARDTHGKFLRRALGKTRKTFVFACNALTGKSLVCMLKLHVYFHIIFENRVLALSLVL